MTYHIRQQNCLFAADLQTFYLKDEINILYETKDLFSVETFTGKITELEYKYKDWCWCSILLLSK